MFVCLCKGVTDTQIKQSIENGATSLRDVRRELGVATKCCKCLPDAIAVIDQALAKQSYSNNDNPLYVFPSNLFFSAESAI
jgi:bacterioferritin-associated ferredoxin